MFHITVKTLANFEGILADEIRALGAGDVEEGTRAVFCTGDMRMVYRLNYELRTALRVLVHITQFKSRKPDDLYAKALAFPWENLFGSEYTFAIDPNVHSAQYRHPHFAALRLKDAIADRFVQHTGSRPDVDPAHPDLRFHLHIDEEKVHISLDSSGHSLNQRGYRQAGGVAPLNEVLAAGMLILCGYKGGEPLYDPMCGSGTLSIEAAMMATRTPAQWKREEFGFTSWPSFEDETWNDVRQEANGQITKAPAPIVTSDADSRQLRIASENISVSGMSEAINLSAKDFFELTPDAESGLLIMNPPYGKRMEIEQLHHLYRRIGERFKHHWPGFKAWVISSEHALLKDIGLKPFRKIDLLNGKIPCRFFGYELYAGSRKRVE